MYSDINPTTPIFPGPVTYRHSRISNIVAILMGKYLICTERKCWHFENTKTIILSNPIKNTKWPRSKISNRYYVEFQKTSQQVIGMFIRLASPYKPSSSFLKKNFQRKRNYWNNFFSFVFPPIANVRHTRKKIPCIARHALSQRLHREKMPETCKKLQWRSARRERESANGVDKTEIPIQRATTKLTT